MKNMTLLPMSNFYANYIHKEDVCGLFSKILWVDKNCNMLNIRTEYPIATNFSVQSGDITNFDESEKYI